MASFHLWAHMYAHVISSYYRKITKYTLDTLETILGIVLDTLAFLIYYWFFIIVINLSILMLMNIKAFKIDYYFSIFLAGLHRMEEVEYFYIFYFLMSITYQQYKLQYVQFSYIKISIY